MFQLRQSSSLVRDVMGAVCVWGGKWIQIASQFSPPDILSTKHGAPDWDQIIPSDSVHFREVHSLKSLSVLVLGETEKSLLSVHFPWSASKKNQSVWMMLSSKAEQLGENKTTGLQNTGTLSILDVQGWGEDLLRGCMECIFILVCGWNLLCHEQPFTRICSSQASPSITLKKELSGHHASKEQSSQRWERSS